MVARVAKRPMVVVDLVCGLWRVRWCNRGLHQMPASCAPAALVLAHVRSPTLQAFAPLALVLAEARLSKLLVCARDTLVLAEARPPPLLLCAPDALGR